MQRTKWKLLHAVLWVVVAQGVFSPGGSARAELRLPDRSVSVAATEFSASTTPLVRRAVLDVNVDSVGARSIAIARSDFTISAGGDIFGARRWNAGRSRIKIAHGHSRSIRLTFAVPHGVLEAGALSYRPADGGASGVLPLDDSPAVGDAAGLAASIQPTIGTFSISDGVGNPWGSEIDGAGNIWFAEPGCDFAPTCAAGTPPGQIVKFEPASRAFTYYTLPGIPGNQPTFVTLDGSGNLWFTTPNNSRIGEFSPSTGEFVGQWPVTAGSGPWDLTFANGRLWYTEHFVSAVGRFDPITHVHQDFQTPSANSNPYGVAASGTLVWFTENNSTVDRIAVLDTGHGNEISEYPIVQPQSGTPHLVVVGGNGHPWWTEGWSNTLATLDPAAATPGSCGSGSGTCEGVQRFTAPGSGTCGGSTHTSGIAYEAATDRLWFDNSLTAQVGSFTPSTDTFDLSTLDDCNAHPHDGLSLDAAGDVWFGEEFANALGELRQAAPPHSVTSTEPTGSLPPANTSAPRIRGTPRQAETLTVRKGSWTNGPISFSYRWQRCRPKCSNIRHATSGSFRLSAGDIDARVRVVVTATNAAGSTRANSARLGPVAPTLKHIRRSLARLLAASTKRWTVAKLLEKDGFRRAYRAPSRGSLRIGWHAGRALIATGRERFATRGEAAVTIRMTRAGKRLLGRARALTVTARAIFVSTRRPAVTKQKRFTLSGS